jgi:hypothetical protein
LPSKGKPGIHLRLDPEILAVLRIEAKRSRLNVVDFTRTLIEAYLRGVGGGTTPPGGLSESTLRKAFLAKLRGLLGQLRFEIATVDVAGIREKRVEDLSTAIVDIAILAKSAEPNDRVRFYQLLGFLIMVQDGLLNNVAKGELLKRLAAVEERLDVGLESLRKATKKRRGKDNTGKQ